MQEDLCVAVAKPLLMANVPSVLKVTGLKRMVPTVCAESELYSVLFCCITQHKESCLNKHKKMTCCAEL